MIEFDELLCQNQEAIAQRWLKAALSSYGAEASAAFARQGDPFANPVGHSLSEGTRAIVQALLSGGGPDRFRPLLEPIVRIRAVQSFAPSEALGFIFDLKAAVRATLGAEAQWPGHAGQLARLDARIDAVALAAFDLFVACRERISQLRANEVARSFSWVAEKLGGRDAQSDDPSEPAAPEDAEAQTELVP